MKKQSLIRGIPAPCMMKLATFVIFKAGQCIEQRFNEQFSGLTIRARHFAVLRVLAHSEALTQQALCESLWIDRATMTGVIKDLLKEDLVHRSPHKKDQRSYILSISPAGEKLYRQHARGFQQLEDSIFPSLSPSELKTVRAILNRALTDFIDQT